MPSEMYVIVSATILLAFVAGVVTGFLWCRAIVKRWVREANLRTESAAKRGPPGP